MSGHTPGPWIVKDDKDYPRGFGVIEGPAFRITWVRVAGDITPEQSKQREIDARLIVAAPELFGAGNPLAELVEAFTGPDNALISVSAGELRKMAAAIAKAKGR